MSARLLVACVGNVLRADDGFGVAVAEHLAEEPLPPDAALIETGIGGMGIVHELMSGYDALIVVDTVERGAPPGTLFVLEPDVPDPGSLPVDRWRTLFSNLHLAEPSRVLLLARAFHVLPERVLLVGCQPESCDELRQGLSEPVEAAVSAAARAIRQLLESLAAGHGAAEAIGATGLVHVLTDQYGRRSSATERSAATAAEGA